MVYRVHISISISVLFLNLIIPASIRGSSNETLTEINKKMLMSKGLLCGKQWLYSFGYMYNKSILFIIGILLITVVNSNLKQWLQLTTE